MDKSFCDSCGTVDGVQLCIFVYDRYVDAAGDSDDRVIMADLCQRCRLKFYKMAFKKVEPDRYRRGRVMRELFKEHLKSLTGFPPVWGDDK